MDNLVKLKMNLLSLIRLGKIELNDSIEDLEHNINKVNQYKETNSLKYELAIRSFENLNKILIEVIINKYNELLTYNEEIRKLDSIKTPGENILNLNKPYLEKIKENEMILEDSISKLAQSIELEKKYRKMINDDSITIINSQTDYYMKEVILNYKNLKLSKMEYYEDKYPEVLVKKYN